MSNSKNNSQKENFVEALNVRLRKLGAINESVGSESGCKVRTDIGEKELGITILNDGSPIISWDIPYDNPSKYETLSKFTSTYQAIYESLHGKRPGEDYVAGEDDDDNEDILLEIEEESIYSNLPEGLRDTTAIASRLGDSLREISKLSEDTEMVKIIIDLANSAYALSLDIEDALETLIELEDDDLIEEDLAPSLPLGTDDKIIDSSTSDIDTTDDDDNDDEDLDPDLEEEDDGEEDSDDDDEELEV